MTGLTPLNKESVNIKAPFSSQEAEQAHSLSKNTTLEKTTQISNTSFVERANDSQNIQTVSNANISNKTLIKHLSKEFSLSRGFLKNLNSEQLHSLNNLLTDLKPSVKTYSKTHLNPFNKITASSLYKASALAFVSLKATESTVVRMGRFFKSKVLISKDDTGKIHIAKKIKTLGSGHYGIAKSFKSITSNESVVIKIAKNKPRAIRDVQSEFKNLNRLHEDTLGSPVKSIKGIQDAPSHVIAIKSGIEDLETGAIGYEGKKYDANGMALKKEILSKERIISIVDQLIYGLHYLKEKKVSHADIKPDNFLLRGQDIHMADFGGAVFYADDINQIFNQVGDAGYTHDKDFDVLDRLNAELSNLTEENKAAFEKKAEELIHAKDLYSMCVALCEIFHGEENFKQQFLSKKDFTGNGFEKILLEKGVPDQLVQLILKGLSANYLERPNTEDFIEAINNLKF